MGSPLDHDRHLPRGARARPRPHHGRALPVLPARRLPEGQRKEADIKRTVPSSEPTRGSIRQGFVYERVPHITLKAIANNAEIDVIWETWQKTLEPLRGELNAALNQEVGGVGDPARGRGRMAGGGP